MPAIAFKCQAIPNDFETACIVMTPSCAASDAAPETPIACSTTACPGAGGPISLASGNTFMIENDIRLAGLGGGLTLDRTWRSLWPATQSAYQIGMFGPNWRSTYEERVFVGTDHYLKYARSDGSFWSFGYSIGDQKYHPAAAANGGSGGGGGSVVNQKVNNFTLLFQNGEKRLFDLVTGKLTAIIDRNGNTTQLAYDSNARLTTVTDPAGRHLYFNYGGSGALVTSVTSDFGVTVSYSYDGQGRLSQVTEPDASTLNFQYDSNSFISAVLDSQGKILESHTYDSSGHGLTSSRANGVEAVTISYQ